MSKQTFPCAVVMYHYVRDVERTPYPAINALCVEAFAEQLDWLAERYRILSYREFAEYIHTGAVPQEPTALLTFDDGLIDHYETVFPLLQERGITGIFFACDGAYTECPCLLNVHKIHFLLAALGEERLHAIVRETLPMLAEYVLLDKKERTGLYPHDFADTASLKTLLNYQLPYELTDALLEHVFTEHIGNAENFALSLYVRPDQIRTMARSGMTFGAHTRSHRVLARLSPDDQRSEIAQGIHLIREITGQEDVPFCYPYGGSHTYDSTTKQLLADAGYQNAFAVHRALHDFSECDPLSIVRHDTIAFPPIASAAPDH